MFFFLHSMCVFSMLHEKQVVQPMLLKSGLVLLALKNN